MIRLSTNDNFHLCCLAQYPHLKESTKLEHLSALSEIAHPIGVAVMNRDKSNEHAKHYLDWYEYNCWCRKQRRRK